MGRPSKYKPEYCEMLIKHMETGLSFESFAGVVSVCRDSLYEWEKVYEEFSYAKKIGFQKNLLTWEKIMLSHAIGKNKGNVAVAFFQVKNRFPDLYKERQDISVNSDKPIVLTYRPKSLRKKDE